MMRLNRSEVTSTTYMLSEIFRGKGRGKGEGEGESGGTDRLMAGWMDLHDSIPLFLRVCLFDCVFGFFVR